MLACNHTSMERKSTKGSIAYMMKPSIMRKTIKKDENLLDKAVDSQKEINDNRVVTKPKGLFNRIKEKIIVGKLNRASKKKFK